ncbi:unnamed protein product [Parascedosporium putredinis]|uniref:glycogenin glucosyltransferase n=1 Tax=Parascedosporium putredinis TaxID=1442378 RepID=A0A9P1M7W0_9PEZI|nr:unnamed protein product [Parascedosporium putredinis]CAI7991316.1 unnamed protein product [Parascedosporium putredinis]
MALSDTYLPGALVLAHSLIDNGATRKLAVLVTENTVSAEAISQLQTVYDYVIPVPTIRNVHPNLQLMNRADLHSAFTKIALWNQTQFSKIVYVDADIVAYRAPEELFDIDAPFSAAPDIGWPDIFNSGVMVLTPDETEYARLADLADRGVSFDGADQGLLNQHFGTNYNRISFTYNLGRGGAADLSPHDGMIARWWAVYDRHYGNGRNQAQDDAQGKKQELVHSTQNAPPEPARNVNEGFFTGFTPGKRRESTTRTTTATSSPINSITRTTTNIMNTTDTDTMDTMNTMSTMKAMKTTPIKNTNRSSITSIIIKNIKVIKVVKGIITIALRTATKSITKKVTPDIMNPSITIRNNSLKLPRCRQPGMHSGLQLWASPSATNAWDEVPGIRKYIERVMDQTGLGGPRRYSAAATRAAQRQQWEAAAATTNRREGFFKVTDFPSVDDRPSLPVTPAPVRTGEGEEVEPVGFPIPPIGDDEDAAASDGQGITEIKPRLAEAEGVPPQSDWNPGAQLERLAKLHHVDTRSVLRRLSADDPAARRIEIPDRSLPPSSEGVLHLDHSLGRQEQEQRRHSHQERSVFSERTRTEERHSSWSNASSTTASIRTSKGVPILAPVPVKAGLPASKAATGRIIPILDEHEDEVEELYNVNGKSSSGSGSGYATNSSYSTKLEGDGTVQLPSYSGPGAAWEPDTYFPRNVTAALPPDEERDILET